MNKISRTKIGFGSVIFLVASAIGFDKYKCYGIHQRALEKATEIGNEPLSFEQLLPRLNILLTSPNKPTYQNFWTFFQSYPGLYLTKAGFDYDLLNVVMNANQGSDAFEIYHQSQQYFDVIQANSRQDQLSAFSKSTAFLTKQDYNLWKERYPFGSFFLLDSELDWESNRLVSFLKQVKLFFLYSAFSKKFLFRYTLEKVVESTFSFINSCNKF